MCERCAGLSRRGLLGAMTATLVAAAGPAPPATITGEQALHQLMAGNARYRANQSMRVTSPWTAPHGSPRIDPSPRC